MPVALKNGEFATADEESAAAGCDRARRRGLVLLVLLRVGDVSFDNDVCRHDGKSTLATWRMACPTGLSTHAVVRHGEH